jgi:hypothetical protein
VAAEPTGVRSKFLQIPLAAFATLFACSQLFGATSSSFSATTATSGNTVTAAANWTPAVVESVVVQKAQGGIVDKIRGDGQFYVYADVSDVGSGSVTASVSNLTWSSPATMSAGSWTVNGTSYNYRSALLTAKNTLSTTSYSMSVTANDGVNTPSTVSKTVGAHSSTTVHNPTNFTTTNSGTSGKVTTGDKMTFTFSNAPDPESLFEGWNGTTRTVNVQLTDGGVFGWSSSTQDVIGITDSNNDVTALGYVVLGGNYANTNKSVTFPNSTMVVSGNTYVVTIGTPGVAGDVATDTGSRYPVWTSYATLFNAWGRLSSAATFNGGARRNF